LILTFTGNWVIGLPLVVGGIFIFFALGDEKQVYRELKYWFTHDRTGKIVAGILGVVGGAVLLFFIFGLYVALIPPGAAILFIVLRKYHKQGGAFFAELMVSIVGLILLLGGIQYASGYLYIEFNIWQMIGLGIVNTVILFILFAFSGEGKDDAEKERNRAEAKLAEEKLKILEEQRSRDKNKYTPAGGVNAANKMDEDGGDEEPKEKKKPGGVHGANKMGDEE
ncbi:MAG: hypothetical protein KAU95_00885, partial [Candidatus Aenigmarchaeota archaeon]|nr:hypothetical protein [Candidatus Aenigmarchaeota archaeon]